MLNGCSIKTRQPSGKLDNKNHDPFQVEKNVSALVVELTLLQKWRIFNILYVLLLEPYQTSKYQAPVDSSKVLRKADAVE